jgi:hypothetical protein
LPITLLFQNLLNAGNMVKPVIKSEMTSPEMWKLRVKYSVQIVHAPRTPIKTFEAL